MSDLAGRLADLKAKADLAMPCMEHGQFGLCWHDHGHVPDRVVQALIAVAETGAIVERRDPYFCNGCDRDGCDSLLAEPHEPDCPAHNHRKALADLEAALA